MSSWSNRENHIAFVAKDRAAVRAFFEAAVSLGAEVLNEPRLWPEYHKNYYGAFVRRPGRQQRRGRLPHRRVSRVSLDVGRIRASYPALKDGYAYLDGAAGTQVPSSVIDAHLGRVSGRARQSRRGFPRQ